MKKKFENEVCCICGGKFACHFEGKPYCNKHYLRMRAHGDVESHPRKNTNTFIVQDDKVYCLTAKGQRYVIDFCDLEKVKKYSWCLSKTGYFVANIQGKVTKLHRFILQAGDGEVVDHIDGNPANNSRSNLRICTLSENAKNLKSKSLGVRKRKNRWAARIVVNYKELYLGTYDTREEALSARQKAEIEYYGDFAPSISRQSFTKVDIEEAKE